jgi:hypothetical protein
MRIGTFLALLFGFANGYENGRVKSGSHMKQFEPLRLGRFLMVFLCDANMFCDITFKNQSRA